jgi:GTPase SAR1 family protein
MTKFYVRNCCAALVVYDVTDQKSFDQVSSWLEFFRVECPDACVMLAGNKCDLEHKRVVAAKRASSFADQHSLTFFECSAKTNHNIEGVREGTRGEGREVHR